MNYPELNESIQTWNGSAWTKTDMGHLTHVVESSRGQWRTASEAIMAMQTAPALVGVTVITRQGEEIEFRLSPEYRNYIPPMPEPSDDYRRVMLARRAARIAAEAAA
jgi:hypothetical protein